VAADIGEKADLARVEDALKTNANIMMLVNNAGFGATAPLLRSDINKMEDMVTLNVIALVDTMVTQKALSGRSPGHARRSTPGLRPDQIACTAPAPQGWQSVARSSFRRTTISSAESAAVKWETNLPRGSKT
jgi:NAD(P)-dependent dehydrogenase (short-subunit alcohol dehydrogenase family)